MPKKIGLSILLAIAVSAPSLSAQGARSRGVVELGIDGGVTFGLDAPKITFVTLPGQIFRVGFFLDEKFELEPRFHFISFHGDGAHASEYNLELGVLYSPRGDRIGTGFYIRPLIGVAGSSATDFGSDNTGYIGAGLGLKFPLADRRLAFRPEVNYVHGFGDAGGNLIGLNIGLSFFTR
jgi:hypothetical protein